MGRIDAIISDDLETEFRKEVSMSLGMKKGNLSLALEEAMKQWIVMRRSKRREAAKKAWEVRRLMGKRPVVTTEIAKQVS